MRKNEKGQAYLLILVIGLSVFIMLSIALYISGYEAQVSASYHANSNLYLLAVSGAEEGLSLINKIGLQAHPSLAAAARTEIFKGDILTYAEYRIESLTAAYEGSFHLKEKDKSGLLGEGDILLQQIYGRLAASYIQTELDQLLDVRNGACYFYYEVNDYKVEVEIRAENSSFLITSAAFSESGRSKTVVEAKVECNFGGHDEILVPAYTWKTPPFWSECPLYAGGVIQGTDIDTDSYPAGQAWVVEAGVYFPETTWFLENPFVFTDGRQSSLDVGGFYSPLDEEPVYTAVYSLGDIILEANDPSRDMFKGIVIARGNIILRDVSTQGSVLAGGDIILEKTRSEGMELQKDTGAVFKIKGENKALERKFYDLLGITNFQGADDFRIAGDRLAEMLRAVTIGKESGLEIRNTEGPLFKITRLRERRY